MGAKGAQRPSGNAVVCDASVLAAMVFGEPRSAEAHSLTSGHRLLAPSLLRYEMAHVAVRYLAAARDDPSRIGRMLAASLHVPIRLIEPSWLAVVELARTRGLSAYDAAYLQLSLALHVPLATLDERLGKVADSLGLRARPQSV